MALPIVRPERAVLTGEHGLARAIHPSARRSGIAAADAGGR
jgi:hypothetical protein